MKDFLEAITILAKYEDALGLHAEHDQFWAGPRADDVSEEDAQRLEELNWFVDKDGDSWTTFV